MTEFKDFARFLAMESAKVIQQYFREPLSITIKPDESPVTIADKKAEELMRERIMKEFPTHGIIGEEFGCHNSEAEYVWVLDPIDGTQNFICGGWMFGTLIGLVKNEEPVLGVFHQPILNEFLLGTDAETTFNDSKVTVRSCNAISDAVMLTTDPYLVKAYQDFRAFEQLREQVKVYRGWGDCYGYFLLATGNIDIMIDPIMNPWDIAALIPIVRGAGGTITDYHGNCPSKGESIVATSGKIHSEVIQLLNVAEN